MYFHYLRIAVRYLVRNKGISLINIGGLSLGIALFILIMLYILNELKYDKSIEKLDAICRLESIGENSTSAYMTSAIGVDLTEAIPEITQVVRIQGWQDIFVEIDQKKIAIPWIALADSNVFDLFSFKFVRGNPETALRTPFSIVLTESTAKTLFGDKDPVGETLKIWENRSVLITGIVRDMENFHIRFDALLSFVTLGELYGQERLYNYKTTQYFTYFELANGANIDTVTRKVDQWVHELYIRTYGDEAEEWEFAMDLRPLEEIYFARNVRDHGIYHGNRQFVYLFVCVALFIIFIACINYINLSTAKASVRSREIGIRKVSGAGKKQLVFQFLGESFLISFLAMILGLLIVQALLPEFNRIIAGDLDFNFIRDPYILVFTLTGILIITVLAGTYPAFYLSRLKPAYVLKGEKTKGRSGSLFRKILIVFQFVISIILIVATFMVYKQLVYLRSKDLGFNKKQIVTLEINNRRINEKGDVFREALLQYPQISKVSFSYTVAGKATNYETFDLEGKSQSFNVHTVDPDYIDLMGIEILEGRNFSWDRKSDSLGACIINEEAVKQLEVDNLVSKILHHDEWYITAFPVKDFEIIGIVKDFHFKSLKQPIEPLIFAWNRGWANYISIKIQPDNIPQTLEFIRQEWDKITPEYPLEYSFLDEDFDRMYKSEEKLGHLFRYFAILAVFIAMLGLFGLAAYLAGQRTKEIGIRKVLGAKVSGIVFLLSREFSLLVIIASIIAWPVAWLGMNLWLKEFAYKTKIGIGLFILSTGIALVIALATVISQTLKAARTNPADSLRYE